jgi:eukaryotic-like serine/threonine-protein kinase
MSISPCPLPTELEDLIAGRLDAERHRTLDRHIESCAPCRAAIEALDEPEDPFFAAVGELAGLAVSYESRPFRQEIDRLRSLPRPGDLPFSSSGRDSLVDGTLGDFRIVRQVARGGMGVVYEAEQISLGRRVALKVLSFAGLLDPRRMQRFQNEVRAAASLEHPHIVPVYAVGSDRGVYYYAMRFIDGPNLAEFIEHRWNQKVSGQSESARGRETLTNLAMLSTIRGVAQGNGNGATDIRPQAKVQAYGPNRTDSEHIRYVVGLAINAARALDFAHERGVIHRDIKPSNLMLDADGMLWITDFGLARIETDPTFSATGEVMGTLRYMSPEQALGKRGVVDHRSDIYSLGVTLYELLTLTYVFSDVPDHVVLAKIASEDPPSPRWLNPAIPVDLETIVLKAMSKEPAERYATADEFASDLEAFREQKKIKAQRRGLADRFARWLRRHPAGLGVAATAVIALVVLAAGFATYSALLRRTVRERDESNVRLETANKETVQALSESKEAGERADRALQESRQQIYAQDVERAARAIAAVDVNVASNLLNHHLPRKGESDLRGFEWYWLRSRLTGTGRTLHVSQEPVYDAEFSPDGFRLAAAGADGILHVLDVRTGKEILRVPTGQIEVNAAVFSPDGKTIATTGDDSTIRLWDAIDGKPGLRLRGPKGGHAFGVVFTPDARQIVASGDDPVIRIWDAQTGALMGELKDSRQTTTQIALAPDGKTLASGSNDGSARLWDISTCQCRRVLRAQDGRCLSVAFSPDGKLLVTGYLDRTVRLWKCSDGTTALAGRLRDSMHDVCFLPNGEGVLAADGGGTIREWKVPREFAPPVLTNSRAFSSESGDQSDGSIAGWRRHVGAIHRIAVDRGGRKAASAGNDGTVGLSDLRSAVDGPRIDLKLPERDRRAFDTPDRHSVLRFQFGPNDEFLCNDQISINAKGERLPGFMVWIYNLETGHRDWALVDQWCSAIASMALTPDGTTLLLGYADGWIRIIRRHAPATAQALYTCNLEPSPQARDQVAKGIDQIDIAPDGRTLIAHIGTDPGRFRLYDYIARRRLDRYPSTLTGDRPVLSHGCRWLATNQDRVGKICDLESPTFETREFHSADGIVALAISPDDSLLASAARDRTIALRSLPTGAVQKELIGHEAIITCLAFSADGLSLLSGDLAGTIKVWSVRTGRFLCDLDHLKDRIDQIQFSPSGRYLAYSAHRGPLVVYDLHRLQAEN